MSDEFGLPFIKVTATGNDFIFIDLRKKPLSDFTSHSRVELTRRIAHRRFGVGSDGVVFVEAGKSPDRLKWDFFNDDGSHAEMCGNATRGMGCWALSVDQVSEVVFDTVPGEVRVKRTPEGLFASSLRFVRFEPQPLRCGELRAILLNTGVPHAVVETEDIASVTAADPAIGAFRWHADVGSRGANVTFLQRIAGGRYKTVTFERGVEDFTLSCGTGVLAAAAVAKAVSHSRPFQEAISVEIEAPGGMLNVLFEENLSSVVLTGAAQVVCSGWINQGVLK